MNKLDRIIEQLRHRFTTKHFDPNFHIEEDVEQKLEEIFNLAPTSFGLQPFRLVKIISRRDREMIKKIAWDQAQVTDCSLLYILAIETDADAVLKRYEKLQIDLRKVSVDSVAEYSEFIRNFLSQRSKADSFFYESWATRQIYLALGFFLSNAALLGIDTAPLEGFDEKKLDNIFKLNKYSLNSKVLLCIGKRSASDEYPGLAKIRKSHFDLVLTDFCKKAETS